MLLQSTQRSRLTAAVTSEISDDQVDGQAISYLSFPSEQTPPDEPPTPGTLYPDQTSTDRPSTPGIIPLDQSSPEISSSLDESIANSPFPGNLISSLQLATSDISGYKLNVHPPGPEEKYVNPTPIKEGSLPFFRPWCLPKKVKLCCHETINEVHKYYYCIYCKTVYFILVLSCP